MASRRPAAIAARSGDTIQPAPAALDVFSQVNIAADERGHAPGRHRFDQRDAEVFVEGRKREHGRLLEQLLLGNAVHPSSQRHAVAEVAPLDRARSVAATDRHRFPRPSLSIRARGWTSANASMSASRFFTGCTRDNAST